MCCEHVVLHRISNSAFMNSLATDRFTCSSLGNASHSISILLSSIIISVMINPRQ